MLALLRILLLEACDIIGIYARPKARRLGCSTTLEYNRRKSFPDSRCIYASLGRDAGLPEWEDLGVDTTGDHILG
jgi:hypothetical protein